MSDIYSQNMVPQDTIIKIKKHQISLFMLLPFPVLGPCPVSSHFLGSIRPKGLSRIS